MEMSIEFQAGGKISNKSELKWKGECLQSGQLRAWETSTKRVWEGDKGTQGLNGVRTGMMLRSIVARFTVVIIVQTSIIV